MTDNEKTREQLIHELTELGSQNTELKKSESAEKYRSLVENLRDVVYELDSQGVVLYISPAIRDLLGYDSTEIVGKNFIELAHKDDLSRRAEWFSELRKGVESPSEYRIINKSGEYKWAQTRVRPIMEDGQFKGARGILLDVTDQRRAEKALRESEEKYRWVLDNMADVITVMDMNLRFTYVSPSIMRMRGYTAEEATAQTLEQVMTPESLQISAKVFEEEMKLEASGTADPDRIRIVELEQYRKDGSIVMMDNHLSFMRDEAKKAVGIISASRDITARKRAEVALKEKVEDLSRLATVVSDSNDAVILHDLDGKILAWNHGAKETYGYTETEALGKNVRDIVAETDREAALTLIQKIKQGDVVKSFELRRVTKDGRILDVWLTTTLLSDEKGKPIAIATTERDITDRKQAEVNLKESKELTAAVVENVPLMIFLKEAVDLRFVIFNRAGEELLGYDRKVLLGKNNLDLFPPEQAAHFMAKNREVLDGESGILDIPEESILTAKKGQRLLHTKKVCIKGSDGVTKFLLGISEDITERKQAEKNLLETLDHLRRAVNTTIQVMVSAVEVRDPYTSGHQTRSADLARAIATEMGLSKEKIEGIRMAGSIHDIGKLSIPAEILSKPTKLTNLEFSLIKEHARKGYEMLKDVESPWPLAEIVYQHHERMDGSGYPRNLKGEDICIEARILTVADVVEAMASHRPYRAGLGIEAALSEIEKNRGIFYDKSVADACLRLFREKGFQLASA